MIDDLHRALDSVADGPTSEFIAHLSDEIEREMSRTSSDIEDADHLHLSGGDGPNMAAPARSRSWRTTAALLASAAVLATAVVLANPFHRDAATIRTDSSLAQTATTPNPTFATPTSVPTTLATTIDSIAPIAVGSTVMPIPTDRWEALPSTPMKPTLKPLVVAMGRDVLVIGGYRPTDRQPKTAGAVFDGRTWRPIPDAPVSLAGETSAVWTGSILLAVSADGTIISLTPGPDQWEVLGKAPRPNRIGAQAVWTGDEMLLASGSDPDIEALGSVNVISTAVGYRPSTKTWRTIPDPPTKDPLTGRSVWTGTEWVRTVGWSEGKFDDFGSIAAYNPRTNRWRELPLLAADQPPRAILMEGSELVVYTTTERQRLDGESWRSAGALPPVPGYNSGIGEAWFIGGQAIRTRTNSSGSFEALEILDADGSWQTSGQPIPGGGVDSLVTTADDHLIAIGSGKAARLRMP